jgi:mannose-6-phosphate isomerase-like protein (cupin superfamily)
MKISQRKSVREDWDKVRSWNYKLKHLKRYQSVVYAELESDHGVVSTNDVERVYFIIEGKGEFEISGKIIKVSKGDVITVPPDTGYDYRPTGGEALKILLFMELWDN